MKSDNENKFTCIQCASKERFKTLPKQFDVHSSLNIAVMLQRCNICCKLTTQL